MANAIKTLDQASFSEEIATSDKPVVVDFWAEWCGPCRAVAPEVEALAQQYGDAIKVVKVDVDANPTIAARYGIQGIPTLKLFRDGKDVATTVGAKRRAAIESDLVHMEFGRVVGCPNNGVGRRHRHDRSRAPPWLPHRPGHPLQQWRRHQRRWPD